jgi:NitT/TauT family transport system substrate-binding protein
LLGSDRRFDTREQRVAARSKARRRHQIERNMIKSSPIGVHGHVRALCLILLGILGAPAARAGDHVVLQLDWIPTGNHQAPFAGIEQGFFAAQDIDLEIRRGTGAADSLTKVATGAADYGYTDIANLMMTPGTGVKAIMSVDREVPHAVLTRGDTGIKSFADLPGHTLGTAPTASSNLYFPFVLQDAKVDASTITIVNVDPSALGPMLLTKRIDGAIMWTTNVPRLKPEADKVGISIVALPFDIVDSTMYGSIVVASEKTLKARADLTRRFVTAMRKSFLFTRDHPEDTAAYVKSVNPQQNLDYELAGLKESNKHIYTWQNDEKTFGTFDPAKVKTTYQWVVRATKADPSVDPEIFIDRSFLPAE